MAAGESRLTQQHLDDAEIDSGHHSSVFRLVGILGILLHVALSGQWWQPVTIASFLFNNFLTSGSWATPVTESHHLVFLWTPRYIHFPKPITRFCPYINLASVDSSNLLEVWSWSLCVLKSIYFKDWLGKGISHSFASKVKGKLEMPKVLLPKYGLKVILDFLNKQWLWDDYSWIGTWEI